MGDNQRKKLRRINLPCKSLNYPLGRWNKAHPHTHSLFPQRKELSDNLKRCFYNLTVFSEIMGAAVLGVTELLHVKLWSDYKEICILKTCFEDKVYMNWLLYHNEKNIVLNILFLYYQQYGQFQGHHTSISDRIRLESQNLVISSIMMGGYRATFAMV